jgi:serine/threonine protein kinase
MLPIASRGAPAPPPKHLFEDDDGDREIDPRDLDIQDHVGGGTTAEVYRGVFNGCVVAVKQFSVDVERMDPKDQVNLKREIVILRRVQHEKLANLIGVILKQNPISIVLEYCLGGCLFSLLHERSDIDISVAQKVKMLTDTATAMDFLHNLEPPIIHRDLKSMNLLLTAPVESEDSEVSVKVADFGIARVMTTLAGDRGKMTIGAGTGHWIAPEVFAGQAYNEKADIYSFAIVSFEIMCREIPFEEEEAAEVVNRVMRGERPEIEASYPPGSPEPLKNLMQVCWADEIEERPSFRQILEVLATVQ